MHNRLHTVHRSRRSNAADLAMGMLMHSPADFGSITESSEVIVPMSVADRKGMEVVDADITPWVTVDNR